MDANDFQAQAAETLQFDKESQEAIWIALLGLSGEVGELSTEYKKKIRDGNSYKIFREKVVEEMGDILWYLSSIATIEDIELNHIQTKCLQKAAERWNDLNDHKQLKFDGEFLDDGRIEEEQLPREFVADFETLSLGADKYHVQLSINGKIIGSPLRDNAYDPDYYRFHDIFHLSYVVVLGWSPVVRKLLGIKRTSDEEKDEIEDGGRATVIDEAISILVFEYAKLHSYFDGTGAVDYELLRTIKMITRHLEVKHCTTKQWEQAILLGFEKWREIKSLKRGRLICSMVDKTMYFENLNEGEER